METGLPWSSARLNAVGRKRRRPALVCEQCRIRKIRCDRNTPCDKCARGKRAALCVYTTEDASSSSAPDRSQGVLPVLSPAPSRERATEPSPPSDPNSGVAAASEPHRSLTVPEQWNPHNSNPAGGDRSRTAGTFWKGRIFGPSHYLHIVEPFHDILSVYQVAHFDPASSARAPIAECKSLASLVKRRLQPRRTKWPELHELLPPRVVADQLLECYLRTFETVFRVFHVPSLTAEYERYWVTGSSPNDVHTARILLVLALGTCFYQGSDRSSLHSTATKWIMAAYNWTSAPNIKHHLTIPGIQIHCLLHLAMQTHGIGGDIAVGSAINLVGMAKQMGLDRDPSSICNMSLLQAEIRRRLWTTILELLVQASIDCGQAPIVSPNDYDCAPPANVNDVQLNEETDADIIPEPLESYTQASAAIILAESLPVRLRITKYLNHIRPDISYDSTLRLGTQLNQSLRTHFDKVKKHMPPFQVHLLTLLTHRFFTSLHLPFAIKAKTDPTYYLSRKITSDVSLLLLGRSSSSSSSSSSSHPNAPPTPPQPSTTNPFDPSTTALPPSLAHASGLFRAAQIQAGAALTLELLAQLDDTTTSSLVLTAANALARDALRDCLADYVQRLRCGVLEGGGAAAAVGYKGYWFLACALAQVDAVREGSVDVRARMAGAGHRALRECVEALTRAAALAEQRHGGVGAGPPPPPPSSSPSGDAAVDVEGWTPDGVDDFGLLDFQFDPGLDTAVPGFGGISVLFS